MANLLLRIAYREAAAAARHYRLGAGHDADLRSAILEALVAAAPRHDSARASLGTYLRRVARTAAGLYARGVRRDRLQLNPKSDTEDTGDEGSWLDGLAGATAAATQEGPEEHVAAAELRAAVARVEATLESKDARLCWALRAADSVAEAAAVLGCHRDTVYARLRRLRAVFTTAGLDVHLYGSTASGAVREAA